MWGKLILTEKDYEYLSKGIAIGVGSGIIVGAMTDDIILFFSLGGVLGIVGAGIFSIMRKVKINRTEKE